MSLDFTTTEVEVNINNYDYDNHEITTGPATVTWSLELETREWGVKSFIPMLRSLEFHLIMENNEGVVIMDEEVKIDDYHKMEIGRYDLQNEDGVFMDFYPTCINVDWKTREVEVEF